MASPTAPAAPVPPAPGAAAAMPHVVLRPSRGWFKWPDLRELWRHRALILLLAWRDLKLGYKQTAIGALWAVIQPLVTATLFWVVFERLIQIPPWENRPYLLFFFAALVPWNLFANSMNVASQSLVSNAHLIQKVYFPRLVIPLAGSLPPLLDFVFAFLVLVVMAACWGYAPTLRLLTIPLFLLLALVTALGVGIWFCAWNVRFRDVRYLLPLMLNVLLYASPVLYPVSQLPEEWRAWYGLNPMAGVIEGFRWAVLGGARAPGAVVGVSAAAALALLIGGAAFFQRSEDTFADEL